MKYVLLVSGLLLMSCFSPNADMSRYDAPADHTISHDGAMHKPGLTAPQSNCSACHGADLLGGDVGVSCYECHDKKW